MKYILVFLVPIVLFSRPPETSTLADCGDGTKKTVTFIDSNNDGNFDKTVYRYCDGEISTKDVKKTLTSPSIPEDFSVDEQEDNNCSQSGITIDLRYLILDSNGVITHEVINYCNNDTTYISEYIAPPLSRQDVFVGSVISFNKENIFTNLNDFFDNQTNKFNYNEYKKFDIIIVNNKTNEIFQRTFNANPNSLEEMFYKQFKNNEIGEDYLIRISTEDEDYLIKTVD